MEEIGSLEVKKNYPGGKKSKKIIFYKYKAEMIATSIVILMEIVCERTVKMASQDSDCHLAPYLLFVHIYTFLIVKDICDCQNVHVNILCICVCLSPGISWFFR